MRGDPATTPLDVTMIWVLMIPCVLAAIAIAVIPVLLTTVREHSRLRADYAMSRSAELRQIKSLGSGTPAGVPSWYSNNSMRYPSKSFM